MKKDVYLKNEILKLQPLGDEAVSSGDGDESNGSGEGG
ncbi:hypothetical protein KCTC32516_00681 [Polaribacter huanghezhanensis]|nr:hypothetical protein KCTC32516_00681 [Polaribacter huanghezhanensis]